MRDALASRGPISQLVFGAGRLHLCAPEMSAATVEAAWEGGVRAFDVAPAYGEGRCERLLGEALRGRPRGDFEVSTKVGKIVTREGSGVTPGAVDFDYSGDAVLRSLETSLERLGLDRVDRLFVHDLSPRWHDAALPARINEVFVGAWPALERLRNEGVVRQIGLGVNDADVCRLFVEQTSIDVVMLAGRTTLLDRSGQSSGFLDLARARGVPVHAAAPFNSGVLAVGPDAPGATWFSGKVPVDVLTRARIIEAICQAADVPLAAAALRWPLEDDAVHRVVAGFETSEQVRVALDALAMQIPDALWRQLEAVVDPTVAERTA